MIYDECISEIINSKNKPSSLFYQLHQCRRSLAEQQLRQNQQPMVQKKKVKQLAAALETKI